MFLQKNTLKYKYYKILLILILNHNPLIIVLIGFSLIYLKAKYDANIAVNKPNKKVIKNISIGK